jgi:hypothetical protein
MILGAESNLGDVQLQLGEGAILTLDVTQAASKSIVLMAGQNQTGHLVLTGDVNSDVDLTVIQVSSVGLSGGINVADGTSLKLTTAQANGQTITGTGDSTVIISGDVLEGASVDLQGIEQAISFADANEPTPTIAVATDATLDLTAAQATGKSITGSGDVRVHGLNADTNLDDVSVATLTVVFDASADISAQTAKSTVDAYELSDGVTVNFSAEQIDGITVTVNGVEGNGVAVLEGDVALGTVDLRNVESVLTLGTDLTVVVEEGATLQITGEQADYLSSQGYTITGGGTVEVTTAAVSASLDLTGILTSQMMVNQNGITLDEGATLKVNANNFSMAVSKDGEVATVQIAGDVADNTQTNLTFIASGISVDLLGTGSENEPMQLGQGAQLFARTEQLAGKSVQGDGTIVLSGDASAGLILSDIAVSLNVSNVIGLSLTGDAASTLPNYASRRSLTVTFAQVSNSEYDAGQADVEIFKIADTLDAQLQGLTAHKIFAIVDDNVTFTGNFGAAEVSVDEERVLTTSAGIASGVTIGGGGLAQHLW